MRGPFLDDVDECCSSFRWRCVLSVLPCEWCRLRNPTWAESTEAVRAMWIPRFRRHPIYSFHFLKIWLSIQSINFMVEVAEFRESSEVGLEAARPFESWQRRFVCATPHTWVQMQLDKQAHKEDRRGMGVTMRGEHRWSRFVCRKQETFDILQSDTQNFHYR